VHVYTYVSLIPGFSFVQPSIYKLADLRYTVMSFIVFAPNAL